MYSNFNIFSWDLLSSSSITLVSRTVGSIYSFYFIFDDDLSLFFYQKFFGYFLSSNLSFGCVLRLLSAFMIIILFYLKSLSSFSLFTSLSFIFILRLLVFPLVCILRLFYILHLLSYALRSLHVVFVIFSKYLPYFL